MPTISNKNRTSLPATQRENDNLNGLSNGLPLPAEYIPSIDMGNYIDPTDGTTPGNADKTGIFGYFKQSVLDKLFGGSNPATDVAKLRPSTFFGNSNTASIASQVIRVTVTNQGSNYTANTIVTFSGGGGTGATAKPIISGGKIVGVQMTAFGSNYTSAPTVGFVDSAGTGAAATAIVSLGGKISSSLIEPEDNSALALLDRNTGQYLGADFYTKQEVLNLFGTSGNANLVYFEDFDQGQIASGLSTGTPLTQEFITISQNSGVGNSGSISTPLPNGTVLVNPAGSDLGGRLYLYDYWQINSAAEQQRYSNAVGVYTLMPRFDNAATNQWLALTFPKRRLPNFYNGSRQLTIRAKWPVDGTFDNTKTFYLGYTQDNNDWNLLTTPYKAWFELQMTRSNSGGFGIGPIVNCTSMVCRFGSSTVTVSSPSSKLNTTRGIWNMLKIVLSETTALSGTLPFIVDQTAKFYVNDVLVATITTTPNEMALYPVLIATGGNVNNNNMMAVDFVEDIAILPSARGNNTSRTVPYPS